MSKSSADAGSTYDTTIPPGDNYDQAHFRLWTPDDPGPLRGVLVAAPRLQPRLPPLDHPGHLARDRQAPQH